MTEQDKERQLWEVARDKLFEKNAEISELKDRIAKLTGENEAYRVNRQPTLDIVFCKDCKRWNRGYFQEYMCHSDVITGPNDFCSYGERE